MRRCINKLYLKKSGEKSSECARDIWIFVGITRATLSPRLLRSPAFDELYAYAERGEDLNDATDDTSWFISVRDFLFDRLSSESWEDAAVDEELEKCADNFSCFLYFLGRIFFFFYKNYSLFVHEYTKRSCTNVYCFVFLPYLVWENQHFLGEETRGHKASQVYNQERICRETNLQNLLMLLIMNTE